MKHLGTTVVFHVADMARSIDFYTTHLGFEIEHEGQPGTYAGLKLGSLYLDLNADPSYANYLGRGHIVLLFDEVDSVHKTLTDSGVEFYSDIGDRFYGMRDFAVKDPDGNRIGIGCSIVG